MTSDTAMKLRASPRGRTLIPGQIALFGGDLTADCLVRDLSETGARLEVSDSVAVPDRFALHIPRLGRSYQAILRWRREGAIGVAFASEERPQQDGQDLRNLEQENRRLRRLLAAVKADPSQAGAILSRESL